MSMIKKRVIILSILFLAPSVRCMEMVKNTEDNPFELLMQNDREQLSRLLDEGVSVHTVNGRGSSLLFCSVAFECSKEIVELLLARGADPQQRNNERATPLHVAALYKRKDLCELMIRGVVYATCKSLVEVVDEELPIQTHGFQSFISLFFWLKNEKQESVSYPLVNKKFRTAMQKATFATFFENLLVAMEPRQLIDQLVDATQQEVCKFCSLKDVNDCTAFEAGEKSNMVLNPQEIDFWLPLLIKKWLAEVFMGQDAINKLPDNKEAVVLGGDEEYGDLHKAVLGGKIDEVRKLLEQGASVDEQGQDGFTALHLADAYGRVKMIVLLVSYGSDVNAQDNLGRTILHYAIEREDVQSLISYIRLGADVIKADSTGMTPIHWAVRVGNVLLVEILLEMDNVKKCLNLTDKNGFTALHLADVNGWEKIITLLVDYGSDVNAQDRLGRTILHYAVKREDIQSLISYMRLGADLTKAHFGGMAPIHCAAHVGNVGFLQKLVKIDGVKECLDLGDSDGRTALFYAIINGHEELFTWLVKVGVDYTRRDRNDTTPLGVALQCSRFPIALFLIKSGADIDSVDSNGRTLLSFAVQREDLVTVDYLLKKGADVDFADNDNMSPMHYAAKYNVCKAALLLIKYKADHFAMTKAHLTPLAIAEKCKCTDMIDLLESLDSCSICLDVIELKGSDVVCLSCDHVFHEECFVLYGVDKICPLCRVLPKCVCCKNSFKKSEEGSLGTFSTCNHLAHRMCQAKQLIYREIGKKTLCPRCHK